MIEQDITLYAGQDFGMTYVVPPGSDMDLSEYEAVCKIRKRPYDDMKLELTPVVQSKQVGFFISGKDSANEIDVYEINRSNIIRKECLCGHGSLS